MCCEMPMSVVWFALAFGSIFEYELSKSIEVGHEISYLSKLNWSTLVLLSITLLLIYKYVKKTKT